MEESANPLIGEEEGNTASSGILLEVESVNARAECI
jgi:hypothetical protein